MFSKVDLAVLAVMFGVFEAFAAEWDPAAKPKSEDTHDDANDPGDDSCSFLSSCHASFLAVEAFDLS